MLKNILREFAYLTSKPSDEIDPLKNSQRPNTNFKNQWKRLSTVGFQCNKLLNQCQVLQSKRLEKIKTG